jgi:hypothetical protein
MLSFPVFAKQYSRLWSASPRRCCPSGEPENSLSQTFQPLNLGTLKPRPRRHRDEKRVTITPLEFVLTNGDARNLFRFRSCKNCRVSLGSTCPFLKFQFNFSLLSPFIARRSPFFSSFPFMRLHTLSFSVSRKSCICHSYENTGGVPQLFPLWNARLAILSLLRVSDPYRPSDALEDFAWHNGIPPGTLRGE